MAGCANGTVVRNSRSSLAATSDDPANGSHSSPSETPIARLKICICSGVIKPIAKRIAPARGKSTFQQLAVFERDDAPLHTLEDAIQALKEAIGHNSVQTLAVIIDNPPDVGNPMLPSFKQGLEHIAFIKLG